MELTLLVSSNPLSSGLGQQGGELQVVAGPFYAGLLRNHRSLEAEIYCSFTTHLSTKLFARNNTDVFQHLIWDSSNLKVFFLHFPCSTENFLNVNSIMHFWRISRAQNELFLMGKRSVGNTSHIPFTNQNLLIIFTAHCKCRQPALHLQCSERLELLQITSQKFISEISHTFSAPSSWSLMHIYPTD